VALGFASAQADVGEESEAVILTRTSARLDQLNRVIYARSFSKTLSGRLRIGFVACAQEIANELADIKMLTSTTTSQFTERLVYLMLVDGHYRKYLSRLHERLDLSPPRILFVVRSENDLIESIKLCSIT
jgi:DNA-binding transcriptional MocR family regulator